MKECAIPRLTRSQREQLDDIEHFVRKIVAELTSETTVVTMRSHGTTTVEYLNEHTGQWLAPIRPSSLAYANHVLRCVESMRAGAKRV
ncbi:hypothetical protein ACWD26_29155 [Streptomyces sp. NPDC002787]